MGKGAWLQAWTNGAEELNLLDRLQHVYGFSGSNTIWRRMFSRMYTNMQYLVESGVKFISLGHNLAYVVMENLLGEI